MQSMRRCLSEEALVSCAAVFAIRYLEDGFVSLTSCAKIPRSVHKRECRHLEALFRDPPPECPICFLPFPAVGSKDFRYSQEYKSCCGKVICRGCTYQMDEQNASCPFCRDPGPCSVEEAIERREKRMALGDAGAFSSMSSVYETGWLGGPDRLPVDRAKAVKLLEKASELGDVISTFNLGNEYMRGDWVPRNVEKGRMLYERAAMMGHDCARYNLGTLEPAIPHFLRKARHWILAARFGNEQALAVIKKLYLEDGRGLITKEEYEKVLRDYQKCVDDAKSEGETRRIGRFEIG